MNLSDLDELEKLYEVNIEVYSVVSTQNHGEDDEVSEDRPGITATLVRRSHCHSTNTLCLELYENQFSYIKDPARYRKSFCCSRCGKYWKKNFSHNQHEQTCDDKVMLNYLGGACHVPNTVLE